MPLEKRLAALESLVGGLSDRLVALERLMGHQTSNEQLHRLNLQEMKEGVEALEEQTPVNSATREVMWQRIEALEGAGSEELPPLVAAIHRRLAALEERLR
jgi:chromosome condensin MukBEF ATPase and DNA-binding subunit MukB